ncbi:hypothetical protein MPER_01850, partial [Moniliophthora perniciosa FA553]
ILIDACWAISYLSDGSNDKIQAVIESGVCRRLVDLLMHNSTSVQKPGAVMVSGMMCAALVGVRAKMACFPTKMGVQVIRVWISLISFFL